MAQISIRRAGSNDAKLLSVLGHATFYEAYFEQDDPHNLAEYVSVSFALEQIESELADLDSTFFIIFAERKAVGYAKMLRNSDAVGIDPLTSIEISRIYIIERMWRKGIGNQLLDHCLEAAKEEGSMSVWLGVWENNARAQNFYKKNGFERVGTIHFPYGNEIGTNFVMEKTL